MPNDIHFRTLAHRYIFYRPSHKVALIIASLSIILLCFTGCFAFSANTPDENPETEFEDTPDMTAPASPTPSPAPAEPSLDDLAKQKVDAMTLEQKIAQLFVVTPEAITGVDTATQAGETTKQALATYPVGGLVYFQKNLLDAKQTTKMIANSQAYAQEACGLPLFIGVDEEGGTVSRIGGNTGFDVPNAGNMAEVGATGDVGVAQEVAESIGGYLADLGFNLNFAPDADVCGDPATDVMALRSFGDDPQLVASMVAAQVEGFTATGILSCAKHFPGIGGLAQDSHEGAIVSEKSLDELRAGELVPFEAAMSVGVPLIMVGHLSTPNVSGDNTPASLNPAIVSDLLRNQLGFDGLIITDSLAMGAVDGFCAPDQVGVAAVKAGVDLVLMPADFPAAYQGLLDAVRSGDIPKARIDESVERVVKTKLEWLTKEGQLDSSE